MSAGRAPWQRWLGIAGLITAIIAIFIPVVGIFIGWVALILLAIAALAGDKVFAVAVVALSIVNYLFMSPTLWISSAGMQMQGDSSNALVTITIVLVLAPIAALILRATGKLAIGDN